MLLLGGAPESLLQIQLSPRLGREGWAVFTSILVPRTPLPQADRENLEMQTAWCGRKGGREGSSGRPHELTSDQKGACAGTGSVSAQGQGRLHTPPQHARERTGVGATLLSLLICLFSRGTENSHSQTKTRRMFQSLAKAPCLPASCTQ